MKVSISHTDEVSRTLQIEVPSEAVAAEYERVYAKAASSAQLPGFRKGKVPRAVLEPRVKGSVNQEVLETLLPQATYDAVQKEAIKGVGRPRIEGLQFDGKGPLTFRAIIDVKPEFSLGAVNGLGLSAPKADVSEKEVDEQVEGLRLRQAKPGAPKAGPAANGDWIKMDFQGFIDGKPFQGGHAEDYGMALGQKQLIPGFEEQLVGSKAGETRQVKVQFPQDYPGQDVAGKEAEFTVVVKELMDLELPTVDDAWAKTFGEEVTDLAFLRERLREAVVSQKARVRQGRLMDGAAEALLDRHKFAIPESLIEAEVAAQEQGEMRRMAQQGLEMSGDGAKEALRKMLRDPAEKRARLSLILEKVAEAQKLDASEADFEAEMTRFAPQLGATPGQAVEWARQSGREHGIKAQIRERKALEWVVGQAKVTDIA